MIYKKKIRKNSIYLHNEHRNSHHSTVCHASVLTDESYLNNNNKYLYQFIINMIKYYNNN